MYVLPERSGEGYQNLLAHRAVGCGGGMEGGGREGRGRIGAT